MLKNPWQELKEKLNLKAEINSNRRLEITEQNTYGTCKLYKNEILLLAKQLELIADTMKD